MTTLEEVQYVRRTTSKSIRATIKSDSISVSLPIHIPMSKAEDFVRKNWETITQKQRQLLERKAPRLEFSPQKPIQTLTFSVHLSPSDTTKMHALLRNGELHIAYPKTALSETLHPYFVNSITYFLIKEAKRIMPDRVALLAKRHGFSYADVKIQKSRGRWGSCSRGKHINLSCYLLFLPQYLIDYVILHELCHTKQMNHSPAFWELMNSVTNNTALRLRAELKRFAMPF